MGEESKRWRREMPRVRSWIRSRSRSRRHLRQYSFAYHLEIVVDFGSCAWLAHTCWRRQHCVSSRTSHGRSFCDSTGWILSQRWSTLETSESNVWTEAVPSHVAATLCKCCGVTWFWTLEIWFELVLPSWTTLLHVVLRWRLVDFWWQENHRVLVLRTSETVVFKVWRCTWTRYFDQFSWTLHHPTRGLHWNVNADFLHWQNAWTTWHVEM